VVRGRKIRRKGSGVKIMVIMAMFAIVVFMGLSNNNEGIKGI
jgi:hypothetical protein